MSINGSSEENSDQEQNPLQKSQGNSQRLNILSSQKDKQFIPIKKQDSNFGMSKQPSSIAILEQLNNSKTHSSSSTIQFQYSPSRQEESSNSLEEQKQQQSAEKQRFQFQFKQEEAQDSINNDAFKNNSQQNHAQKSSNGSFISDQSSQKQQSQEKSQKQFEKNDNEVQQESNTKRSESSSSNDQEETLRQNGYAQFLKIKDVVSSPEKQKFIKCNTRSNSSASEQIEQLQKQDFQATQNKQGLQINISTEELKKFINISKESISKKERKSEIASAVELLEYKLVSLNIERDNYSKHLIF